MTVVQGDFALEHQEEGVPIVSLAVASLLDCVVHPGSQRAIDREVAKWTFGPEVTEKIGDNGCHGLLARKDRGWPDMLVRCEVRARKGEDTRSAVAPNHAVDWSGVRLRPHRRFDT